MAPIGTARKRRLTLATGALAVAAIVFFLIAGTGSAKQTSLSSSGHVVSGGTAYFAEPPSAVPNYIFPFMGLQFFSVSNISDLQQLMYRPVYWFGNGSNPTLNTSLSLASVPKYSKKNTVVSFTLKPYKWSNGETVTAQDVVFWMNMLKVEYLGWAAYAPGGMPDDVKSVVATSPTSVTITLTGAANPYWFTYNELSQISPFPMAWDVTAAGQKSGSEACAKASYASVTVKTSTTKKGGTVVTPVSAAAKSCAAVYSYLSQQSGYDPANPKAAKNSLKTYATNPIWQVVDGPWHLTSFDSSGNISMAPNPTYSGPIKPKLASFVQLPFTSGAAEFNSLVGGKITVGYLPTEDITSPAASPLVPGKNNPRLSNFNLAAWYSWGFDYFPYNFHSVGDGGQAGKIFSQLYFRQAFQSLVDQPLYNDKIYKNYSVPTYGPVPVLPKNSFATKYESQDPYPYSPAKAIALLTANGWKVDPKGVTTCVNAAKCHVPAGTPLSFTIQYASGTAAAKEVMEAQQAAWQQAGIKITLTTASFDTVLGNAVPCSGKSCTWELENWSGGWVYAPDYYPSGEELFQTGAGSNSGDYSDPTNDKLIHQTDFGTSTLAAYENYLAKQLPVVWQPNPAYAVTEIQKNLHGVTPQNPLLAITPENWYFTK